MEICVHLEQVTNRVVLSARDSQSTTGQLSLYSNNHTSIGIIFPTVATAMNEIVPYKDR